MIAILAALPQEIVEFKKIMSIRQVSSYHCCRFYAGKFERQDVLLVISGVGGEHARQVTELILATYPVTTLLSTGFCGSLNARSSVGDIAVYEKLIDGERLRKGGGASEVRCDAALVELASSISQRDKARTLRASGVTVSRLCCRPQDKGRLGRESGADVVDMESYFIAKVALERKVPFLTARVVSDDAEDDLSILQEITSGTKFAPSRLLSQLTTHPSRGRDLVHILRNSRRASRSLADFLAAMLADPRL